MRFSSKRAIADTYNAPVSSESGNNKTRVIPCFPCHGWNSYFTGPIKMNVVIKFIGMCAKNYPVKKVKKGSTSVSGIIETSEDIKV